MIGVATAIGAPWRGLFKVHFDFLDPSKYTLGKMANLTPWNLGFLRASAATVQTSASTVDTSPITDQPRFGNNGTCRGLDVEESRQNGNMQSRTLAAGGTGGYATGSNVTPTANDEIAPDGTSVGFRSQVLSGGYSNYRVLPVGNATLGWRTWSIWFRRKTGVADGLHQWIIDNAAANTTPDVFTATQSWVRRVMSLNKASGGDDCVPGDGRDQSAHGGHTALALDIESDMLQFELGAFPTNHIPTSGGAGTRAGERLYYANGVGLIDSGALGFYAKLQPKGSATQYGANMRLYTIDANNYGEISATTQKISVVVGGVAYTPATALAWNGAADTIEVQVTGVSASTNTVCKYRVNGGATVTLGTSGAPQGAYAPGAGAVDLLCNGTSNQFTAWVQFIGALRAGRAIL